MIQGAIKNMDKVIKKIELKEKIRQIKNLSKSPIIAMRYTEKVRKKIKVEILIDIPEFLGEDNILYGGFKKGQVVEINEKDGEFLITRSLARKIEKEV